MNNTNEVKVINWYDIKDSVNIINENTSTKRITTYKVKYNHTNKVNTLDGSIQINHAICKKVTAKVLEPYESILIHNANDKVKYHCVGGIFNGKTVCVKCRSNNYNDGGNFTFTDDDLSADMIAIYYYDENNNVGHFFICDRSRLRKNKMKKSQNIYICNQDYIKQHAWNDDYKITFNK